MGELRNRLLAAQNTARHLSERIGESSSLQAAFCRWVDCNQEKKPTYVEKLFIGVADIDDDGRIAPKRLVVFREES